MTIAGLLVASAFIALAPTASAANLCASTDAEGKPAPGSSGPFVARADGGTMTFSAGLYDPSAKSKGVYVSVYDCGECPPEDPDCGP